MALIQNTQTKADVLEWMKSVVAEEDYVEGTSLDRAAPRRLALGMQARAMGGMDCTRKTGGDWVMKLQDIKNYFAGQSPEVAPRPLAAAYAAWVISRSNTYASELIQGFEGTHAPGWLLPYNNLYAALKFLDKNGLAEGYWLSINDQPRPRRMYKPVPGREDELRELGELFTQWKIENIGGGE